MQNFMRQFIRMGPGRWASIGHADLELPSGAIHVCPGMRFTRGTTHMGTDLAQLLDEEYEKDRAA
jgi:hypothetical protein